MARVVVFGDSIVHGTGDPTGGGWVGRSNREGQSRFDTSDPELGDHTDVYNCGIGGETASGVLARLETELIARRGRVAVIATGINDTNPLNATPLAVFERTYRSILEVATRLAAAVLVVTPTNVDESRPEHAFRNSDIAPLVATIERLAGEFGLPVVNVFGTLTPDDLAPDGLHPGPQGYDKLHALITPMLFAIPQLS